MRVPSLAQREPLLLYHGLNLSGLPGDLPATAERVLLCRGTFSAGAVFFHSSPISGVCRAKVPARIWMDSLFPISLIGGSSNVPEISIHIGELSHSHGP